MYLITPISMASSYFYLCVSYIILGQVVVRRTAVYCYVIFMRRATLLTRSAWKLCQLSTMFDLSYRIP